MLNRFLQRSEPISFIILMILMSFFVFFHLGFSDANGLSWLVSLQTLGTWLFFLLILILFDVNIQKYKLTPLNHFALFIFIILMGIFPKVLTFNKYTISFLLILISFYSIFNLRFKEDDKLKLFNSGFVFGIAYLVYPNIFIFLLIIYIGYFVYLKIIDKRLLIPILAFFTPIFLTFTYFYLIDGINNFHNLIEINLDFNKVWLDDKIFVIPFAILISILLAITLKSMTISAFSQLETERNYKIIIAFFLMTVLLILLDSKNIQNEVIYLFFPASILIGNGLIRIKREWLLELILYLLLLFPMIMLFL